MADPLPLSDQQLDRLADLLAIKLARVHAPAPAMLTVEDVCATFQVSRAWVYENAGRLGGKRLGPGQRAPLRFDKQHVEDALSPLNPSEHAPSALTRVTPRRRAPANLLPVYDG